MPDRTKPLLIATVTICLIAVGIGILLWVGKNTDDIPQASESQQIAEIKGGFTFFNLGPTTRLTKQTRKDLSAKLGADAIERKGIIDLKTIPHSLLADHFPSLEDLNRRLNSAVGARVEHNISRLTYRYPGQRGRTPFTFVELVFSNQNKRPLYFRLTLKKEGMEILKTLGEKYGEPRTIAEVREGKAVYHWEKNRDRLIISKVRDRLGNDEYHVMFYFVTNLEHLIETEAKISSEKEKQLERAGKKAF